MSQSVNPGQSTGTGYTRRTDAAARQSKALALRLSGLGYEEIATRLGYKDKSGAWRAVESALTEVRHERASEVMSLDLTRLDILLNAVWEKALGGDVAAFDRVLKVLDRRAKYFDLDGHAESTSEQLRAVQELAFAQAVAKLAEVKDLVDARVVAAIYNELSRKGQGLPSPDIPWEVAKGRIESFEKLGDERDGSDGG